jgi:hypothetical protein
MKQLAALLSVSVLMLTVTSALADSTISNLNSGGTIQTQDNIPIARPSSPGTNFRVNVGSAATVNIGTSGATVPLLNGTNIWSALQTYPSGDLTAADPVFTGGSILLPSGTTGQRPGSPVNGMLRYNSTTPGVEAYVNGVWGPLAGSGGITALTGDGAASGTGSVPLTLATVNSSPGSYGDASHVATYTVNGKGLVTVSGVATITPSAIGAPTTTGTGASGTWAINVSGNSATVTTNASLTGPITSTGNATSVASQTGTGSIFAMSVSPVFTGTVKTGLLDSTLNATSLPSTQTGSVLQVANADTVATRIEEDSFGAPSFFSGVRRDGTNASPTTLQSNDEIASLNAWGYNGTAVVGPQAAFREYAAQNWSVGANGTYLSLATTPNGSTTLTEAMRVENDGGITIPSTVSGGDKGASTINASGAIYGLNFVAAGTGADTLPVGTTGQRPGSPVVGQIRVNTTTSAVEAYYNSTWNTIGSSSGITSVPLGAGFSITEGTCNASPLIGGSTLYGQNCVNTYTGSHTVSAGEMNGLDVCNSSSAMTMALAQAGSATGFKSGDTYSFVNMNTGTCTISTTTSVFNGMALTSSNIPLAQYGFATCTSDGTNWNCSGIETSGGGSMVYPGTGIANSTGSAWGTSYSTTGSGSVVALATSPIFVTPTLGVATATTINGVTIPSTTDTTALLGTNQSWTKGQAVTPDSATSCGTQTSGGTMTPNFANANSCLATFGAGNLTIANPTNIKAGQSYNIALTQDGTGSRTATWGSDFKWAGGTAPTLSTGASDKDVIACWADTTTTLNCVIAGTNFH